MTSTPRNSVTTILVVEDDRDIVQTIKGNLELDGYHVVTAYDGRSALEMAKTHRPGLVILDLNLPDIDGIRVCQIMRREFDFPFIMLTARDALSDRVLGLECGADDYMAKPFSSRELTARIKAILKRVERRVVKDQWEVGDLCINFRTRTFLVRGEEVKLTKTEFELLEFFLTNPDEVLTRDVIQAHVWRDSQLYAYSRAVDVHVQRLRKKIEADAENPQYFVTIARAGYRFRIGSAP